MTPDLPSAYGLPARPLYAWPDDWALYGAPLDGYIYAQSAADPDIYIPIGLVPRPPEKEPVPTALYRLRAAGGELLYVGISNNPGTRWEQHAADKEWWPKVADKTVEWFTDEPTARAAEIAAIKKERPLHNQVNAASPMSLSASWQAARVRRSYEKGAPTVTQQVIDVLRAELTAGYLRPGDRLPTRSEMSQQLRVGVSTCAEATKLLADEGLIVKSGLRGAFVLAARHP